jgi:hypothetical protein
MACQRIPATVGVSGLAFADRTPAAVSMEIRSLADLARAMSIMISTRLAPAMAPRTAVASAGKPRVA